MLFPWFTVDVAEYLVATFDFPSPFLSLYFHSPSLCQSYYHAYSQILHLLWLFVILLYFSSNVFVYKLLKAYNTHSHILHTLDSTTVRTLLYFFFFSFVLNKRRRIPAQHTRNKVYLFHAEIYRKLFWMCICLINI